MRWCFIKAWKNFPKEFIVLTICTYPCNGNTVYCFSDNYPPILFVGLFLEWCQRYCWVCQDSWNSCSTWIRHSFSRWRGLAEFSKSRLLTCSAVFQRRAMAELLCGTTPAVFSILLIQKFMKFWKIYTANSTNCFRQTYSIWVAMKCHSIAGMKLKLLQTGYMKCEYS